MSVDVGSLVAGRYRLEATLGSGASATVWRAHDLTLDRRVAVKVLHRHLRDDDAVRERFRREAIAAGRLNHPSIVAVYDTVSGSADGGPSGTDDIEAIVLEYVEGPSLRTCLDDTGPLPLDRVVPLLRALLGALDEAHRKGVIHRDVKPGNILVAADGRPRLTDFGIARAVDDAAMTATGLLIGTASYLSPEQVEGHALDARSDLYSLGIVAYEMLIGSVPFRGDSSAAVALARLREPAPRVDHVDPRLPPWIGDIVERALEQAPAHRFPDAATFLTAVERQRLESYQPRERPLEPVLNPAASATHPSPAPVSPGAVSPTAAAPTASAGTSAAPPVTDRQQAVRLGADRRSKTGSLVLSVMLLGAIGLVIALVWSTSRDTATRPGTAGEPLSAVAVRTFDPEGTGTPGENDSSVARVIDGDATTTWRTESYDAQNFGTKSGVGVIVELADPASISGVLVDSESFGWSADVFVGNDATGFRPDDTKPAGSADGIDGSAEISVDGSRGQFVLLWIRILGDDGPRHRVGIKELTVTGAK